MRGGGHNDRHVLRNNALHILVHRDRVATVRVDSIIVFLFVCLLSPHFFEVFYSSASPCFAPARAGLDVLYCAET